MKLAELKEKLEEVKERVLEKYGDWPLIEGAISIDLMANGEKRDLTEEETEAIHDLAWLARCVEGQMLRLASSCAEPVWDPAAITKEERDGLRDYFSFSRGRERIAARAELVQLHEPDPEGLSEEEYEDYLNDGQPRETFIPYDDIRVSEAINYVAYWVQESELDGAMHWFLDEWSIHRGVAEITGEKPPETVGEFGDYLKRRAEEEEEGGGQ